MNTEHQVLREMAQSEAQSLSVSAPPDVSAFHGRLRRRRAAIGAAGISGFAVFLFIGLSLTPVLIDDTDLKTSQWTELGDPIFLLDCDTYGQTLMGDGSADSLSGSIESREGLISFARSQVQHHAVREVILGRDRSRVDARAALTDAAGETQAVAYFRSNDDGVSWTPQSVLECSDHLE